MLKKEFVPHEQSLALKELGFNEPCFGYFNTNNCELFLDNSNNRTSNDDDRWCSAPTFSQAFRWFREKYKLQHHIWSGKINSIFYGYDILNIEEQEFVVNNSDISGGDCDYETYEEAELVCLKKLIQLAK